jgi:hypothetical protein
MPNLNALTITKAGRQVLAQAQTEQTLHFTRVAAGDGIMPEETVIDDMTAMISHVMDLPINSNKIIGDGTTKLEAVLRNRDLETLFEFREVAIFAWDHDLEEEILYAYSNSGDAPAAYIPAGNGPNAVNLRIGLITIIKQAANVVVNISEDLGFLSLEEWHEFLNGYNSDQMVFGRELLLHMRPFTSIETFPGSGDAPAPDDFDTLCADTFTEIRILGEPEADAPEETGIAGLANIIANGFTDIEIFCPGTCGNGGGNSGGNGNMDKAAIAEIVAEQVAAMTAETFSSIALE